MDVGSNPPTSCTCLSSLKRPALRSLSLGASRLRALRRMFDHARVSKQGENALVTSMVHCGKGVFNSSMSQALTGLARRLEGLRLCFWDARLGALDLVLPYRSESFLTALILRRPISGLVPC